jgi:formylglycine-generating enzyme required for sulfatase activity
LFARLIAGEIFADEEADVDEVNECHHDLCYKLCVPCKADGNSYEYHNPICAIHTTANKESKMNYIQPYYFVASISLFLLFSGCEKNNDSGDTARYPSNPLPADHATNQPLNVNLSWTDGDPDHPPQNWDVYFGTYGEPPLASARQAATTYDPGTLAYGTTYYWKIVARYDSTHQTPGPIWSFTTVNGPPVSPYNPNPGNGARNQPLHTVLSWSCSDNDGDTLTYDVHFGTSGTPPLVHPGQSETSFNPGILDSNTTYYWQIDAHDSHNNMTSGPRWSFTTAGTGSLADMVLVPAGQYNMGADYDAPYSVPIHSVNVPAFYMDVHELTNAQYKAFCDSTHIPYPDDPGFSGMPNYFTDPAYVNHPVVNVLWQFARYYAAWCGKRLPSEAEWERAAKGNADNRQWPWGDTWVGANANTWNNPADGYTNTSPVGSYPGGISPVGCYDMAGNAWEWCEDDEHETYAGAPTDGSAWVDYPRYDYQIYRGGAFNSDSELTRCAIRINTNPDLRPIYIGLRCARTP